MEKKIDSELNLNTFYRKNKNTFEIVGFVMVLAALFLQIPIKEDASLKNIQALLLILVLLSLLYLVFLIWKDFVVKTVKSKATITYCLLYASISYVFIMNIFTFTLTNFRQQLLGYWGHSKVAFFLLFSFYTDRLMEKASDLFGRPKLWKVVGEILFTASMFLIFWYSSIHLMKTEESKVIFGVILAGVLILNILYSALKVINLKIFVMLLLVMIVFYGFYYFVKIVILFPFTKPLIQFGNFILLSI